MVQTTGNGIKHRSPGRGAVNQSLISSTHLSLHYHIVFGTKDREPLIQPAWRGDLYAYLGGIIRTADGKRREDAHALRKLSRSRRNICHAFRTKCLWSAMRLRIAFWDTKSFQSVACARFARSIWNCYAVAAWNSTNVTFDPTPLPGLGTVLYPITGGLHHRLIFNIPRGLVSAPPKKW